MASKPIMQFRAELIDAHIPIWRRFQVMDDLRFSRLAYIIMTMFEMQASHLFAFEIDRSYNFRLTSKYSEIVEAVIEDLEREGISKARIELIDEEVWGPIDWAFREETGVETLDAAETVVKHQLYKPGSEAFFEYDFGDGWEVKLTLEEIFKDETLPGKELPRVIDGEGYGIIEDCGGVGGLREVDYAFRKGSGAQYEELCDWMGIKELDLLDFDIDDMNYRLKKVPRIYKDVYELQLEPTERSIFILERGYMRRENTSERRVVNDE